MCSSVLLKWAEWLLIDTKKQLVGKQGKFPIYDKLWNCNFDWSGKFWWHRGSKLKCNAALKSLKGGDKKTQEVFARLFIAKKNTIFTESLLIRFVLLSVKFPKPFIKVRQLPLAEGSGAAQFAGRPPGGQWDGWGAPGGRLSHPLS